MKPWHGRINSLFEVSVNPNAGFDRSRHAETVKMQSLQIDAVQPLVKKLPNCKNTNMFSIPRMSAKPSVSVRKQSSQNQAVSRISQCMSSAIALFIIIAS